MAITIQPCARLLLAVFGTAVLCCAPLPLLADDTDLAMAVKATYLYKFAPFIAWPSPAAEFPNDTFVVCVVGQPSFEDLLNRAMAGHTVDSHKVVLRILPTIAGDPGCSVLFALGSPAQSAAAILEAVRGWPIVTVTDEAFSATAKGMIHFVLRDNRVRFEIDQAAMAATRLSASSKLLSLAIAVHQAPASQ